MRIYAQDRHLFFDDLIAMLSSLRSLILAMESHSLGKPLLVDPTNSFRLSGCTIDVDLIFHPYELMTILASDGWPTRVEFAEEPRQKSTPKATGIVLSSAGFISVQSLITQSSFVRYYETLVPLVEAKFTEDRQRWPEVLNFGRIIRNAFVHRGMIHFENARAPSVSWRGLTYGPTDNGRHIMYRDVSQVEIILLMEEMDLTV